MSENSTTMFIREGVETILSGEEVSCANIAKTSYEVDGKTQHGRTASLVLPGYDHWLRLGAGQTFKLKGQVWEITKVAKDGVYVQLQEGDKSEEE